MTDETKILKPLCGVLPEIPEKPEIDEDGALVYRWFAGDSSATPLYVTNGHVLLLASAIDPALVIKRTEKRYVREGATEEACSQLWKESAEREDLEAVFIGVSKPGPWNLAFLRDTRGRVMVVDAWYLAFAVKAVHPDRLTVSAAEVSNFNSALALHRSGVLVGLIMPMRNGAEWFPELDFHGPAFSLAGEPAGMMGHSLSAAQRVKAILPHCYPVQLVIGGFAIIAVKMETAKDGVADSQVISGTFPSESDAWADVLRRLEVA